jgi:hypothetical protein
VEQELLTLPEHLSSPGFSWGLCCSIFSFICMFCRSLLVFLYFFFWPLCCLFFFDIRFLIVPLVSSNSSCFEAGHGKGPCDGLGGCTKCMADQAMKSGKVVIFFVDSHPCAQCVMLSSNIYQQNKTEIEAISTKTIKGTMKIHAIVGNCSNTIFVRDVSCYCEVCIQEGQCNTGLVK